VSTIGAINKGLAGMQEAERKLEKTADRLARLGTDEADESLPRDVVDLKLATTAHAAGLAVVKTAREAEKKLIDILA
jgi:hypothetical protein